MLPILSNLAFLPMVYAMTEVFMCVETSGDDLTDSFLRKDCYETCWEGEQLTLSLISLACLCFYIPTALYIRPKWQEL